MWNETPLAARLGMRWPIVQGPMSGGPSTPELTAAVSEAGGLGCMGAGYLPPGEVRAAIRAIRRLTARPFAVNLFVPPSVDVSAEQMETALQALEPWRAAMGLPPRPDVAPPYAPSFDEQVEVLLEERVPVFSWTFGIPGAEWMDRLRSAGVVTMGTATTVDEARALADAGVDAVVAQGSEAGGHRGTFLHPAADALIGTLALVPQVVDAVRVPVVAAGGIMDGRGIAAVLALGAQAAQLGSAFLTTAESGANPLHKAALMATPAHGTVVTRAFTGREARGIANRFAREMAPHQAQAAPYPAQHAFTRELRARSAALGSTDAMSMWAGQGSPLARAGGAAELVDRLAAETSEVFARLR
ncbi:MAG: hypothetical protein JWM27_5059 [Gemmatimonadetes bacterium]|nr:hypothetical protein [Gemmatimonadota bacterium]